MSDAAPYVLGGLFLVLFPWGPWLRRGQERGRTAVRNQRAREEVRG